MNRIFFIEIRWSIISSSSATTGDHYFIRFKTASAIPTSPLTLPVSFHDLNPLMIGAYFWIKDEMIGGPGSGIRRDGSGLEETSMHTGGIVDLIPLCPRTYHYHQTISHGRHSPMLISQTWEQILNPRPLLLDLNRRAHRSSQRA